MAALPDLWPHLQRQLFPVLAEELGPLGAKDERFVEVVALLPVGGLLARSGWCGHGRPPHERLWLLHAFIAKAVCGYATTEALLDALASRPTLRRLCGGERAGQLPERSTFSRASGRFADDEHHQPRR